MNNSEGFSLIELMTVVAVIGVLSAIAFPAYSNYVRVSKETASIANCVAAEKFVKAEISKRAGGGQASDDVIRDLNLGGKKSPYKPTIPAFMASMDLGVVRIDGQNLNAAVNGSIVTIECDSTGDGLANFTIPMTVE